MAVELWKSGRAFEARRDEKEAERKNKRDGTEV